MIKNDFPSLSTITTPNALDEACNARVLLGRVTVKKRVIVYSTVHV